MTALKIACALTALVLTGCQTSEQRDNTKQMQLNAGFVGKPLSAFMLRNGVVPINAFDTGGQRVFIFGPPCGSWWFTTHVGTATGPETFRVDRMEIHGYCP